MMRPLFSVFSLILIVVCFSGAVSAAQPAPHRVLLVLGDSLSAGYGIAQGQEWVTLLSQRFAREAQPVKVVNASISGETTSGGVARIKPLLERETPAWVLIELGGNDGLRGMSLVAMEANLQAMVDAVEESGAQPVLLGIKIPPNYGNKYRSRFEQVFVDVSERNDVALLPFLLDGVGGIDNLMQADRIHPNQQAQPLIADNVWEFLKPVMVKSDN